MPLTTIIDKNAPNGRRDMDLPEDFVESIECQAQEPVESFLARHSPLTAHACWIWVRAPQNNEEKTTGIDQTTFQTGLSWLRSRGDAVTMDDVNAVARNSHCTCGKWKVRVFEEHLEEIWGRIAQAVHSGSLKACVSAKVSTRVVQAVRNRGTEHTVYIYVDNYLNEKNVSDLRGDLEKILLVQDDEGNGKTKTSKVGDDTPESKPAAKTGATLAQFKPDIFTYMGWGTGRMPPLISVYHALEPLCARCGKRAEGGAKLKRCTACKQTFYCNVECQRRHWKSHKPLCRQAQASSGDSTTAPAAKKQKLDTGES